MVERLQPLVQFGELLRGRRKKAGLTQTQLAERIGADQTSISDWENGKNLPTPALLARIKRELGITQAQVNAALLAQDDVTQALTATTKISARARDALLTLYREAVVAHRQKPNET